MTGVQTCALPILQVGTSSWIQIDTTGTNTFAIKTDNTLWGWGASPYTADGTGVNRSSPVQILSTSWTQISVNNTGVLGIYNNQLYNWGDDDLGGGTNEANYAPYPNVNWGFLNNSIPATWNSVAVGPSHLAAIDKTSYNTYVWGNNKIGRAHV